MDLTELLPTTAAKVGAGLAGLGVGGTALGLGIHFGASREGAVDVEGRWDELMRPHDFDAQGNPNYTDWFTDPVFGLGSYGCSRRFFPDVSFPTHHTIYRYKQSDAGAKEQLAAAHESNMPKIKITPSSTPSDADKGTHIGCNHTDLRIRGRQFLLRAETAFRNEKVGMVFWLAAKTVHNDWSKGSAHYVYIMSFMAFLEKSNGVWNLKGGIGWREMVDSANVSKITIKSPTNDSLMGQYSSLASPSEKKTIIEEAEWREESGQQKLALEMSQDGHSNQNYAISTYAARGYKDTDVFLYKPEEYGWWKRFEKDDKNPFHIKIDAGVWANTWYNALKGNGDTRKGK